MDIHSVWPAGQRSHLSFSSWTVGIHSNSNAFCAIRHTVDWLEFNELPHYVFILYLGACFSLPPIVTSQTSGCLWFPNYGLMYVNVTYPCLVLNWPWCGQQSDHGLIAIWSTCHNGIVESHFSSLCNSAPFGKYQSKGSWGENVIFGHPGQTEALREWLVANAKAISLEVSSSTCRLLSLSFGIHSFLALLLYHFVCSSLLHHFSHSFISCFGLCSLHLMHLFINCSFMNHSYNSSRAMQLHLTTGLYILLGKIVIINHLMESNSSYFPQYSLF